MSLTFNTSRNETPAVNLDVWFPPKLQCLFTARRYKVLYGGRGGAKSWGVARWLLIEGAKRPILVLCARELQKSIKDSVHKLLEQQIKALGLESIYDVQEKAIKGSNGTSFNFEGIRYNVDSVRSYEGVDYCWVEEAHSVTDSSWDVLIPTIRKPGSEIIVTFNPVLETDATYRRFIAYRPSNAFVEKLTWRDNPWFKETELPQEMEDLKARDYDAYLHVWEGECKQNLEGAVYADELREATSQGRIVTAVMGGVPVDKALSVATYWDLGRSDHTSIWFVQRVGFEFHVVDFYQSRLKHIDHYLGVLQTRGYLYDTMWLPHDGRAKQLGMKMTIEEQVREKFPGIVRIVPKVSIKDKIHAARTVFPNCYFDAGKCAEGIHALRHYKYEVDEQTKQYSQIPLHDENSDAASAFEYFGVASRMPTKRKRIDLNKIPVIGRLLSPGFEELDGMDGMLGSPPDAGAWMGR